MSVVTDYPDYSPHYAHAQQIAATGVPLLALPQQLYSISGKVVFSASTDFEALVPVTQPGYHCGVSVQFPAAATVPFVKVSLFWTDSRTSANLASEHYIVPGAQSPAVFTVLGSGIAKGSLVQLRLTNLDPAQNATVSVTMNADSIPRSRDSWLWENALDSGLTVPGFTLSTLPDDESVLGVLNGSTVAASASSGFLFGMAPGALVQLAGATSGITPSSAGLIVSALPSSVYTSGGQVLNTVLAAAQFSYQFIAPRAPLFVQWSNKATTGTLSVSGMMTAQVS